MGALIDLQPPFSYLPPMTILALIVLIVLFWIVLRLEAFMADFTKLTAAVDELTVEVDAAVAALAAGHGENPAVQKAVDDVTAAVKVQSDKLLAAVATPAPTP